MFLTAEPIPKMIEARMNTTVIDVLPQIDAVLTVFPLMQNPGNKYAATNVLANIREVSHRHTKRPV